ncbi:hypothetical protein [Rhodopirellula islandica]|uniref:hypothetical protein n=1 Tax=Rhodopirellula islandica TaxID=595434 RepID=UPI0012378F00|nr:hypothetical protein [Rhodopirellula islandica]
MNKKQKMTFAGLLGCSLAVCALLSARQPASAELQVQPLVDSAVVSDGETIENWEFTARRGTRCRYVGSSVNRFVGN